MSRIALDGITLAVGEWPGPRQAGADKTVVCVHGLSANHTCWASVAGVLSPAYRVIAYDLRGRGDSDKPDTGYDLETHGDDLARLLDHYGLDRAVVMGHSLGAKIALSFAAKRPERVSRLVLFDGGIDIRPEVWDSIAPAVERLGIEFPSLDMFLAIMRSLPMFAGRWNEYFERYFRYDVELLPSGAVRAKAAKHAIEEDVSSLKRERLWVRHRQVQCPTLVFRAPDGLLGPADCLMTEDEALAMAAAIPACRLVTVPGANHYTVLLGETPEVKSALRAFLAGA
jgi:pimeloyl-ACP methyl ester carboxylesterase